MPFYQIHHSIPLSVSQQDELAVAITNIHSTKFSTPKNFINVSFHDISATPHYIGGKRVEVNQIFANVRTGPSRTQADWEELIRGVEKAWYDICGIPLPRLKGRPEPDTKLRGVFVVGGRVAAMEAGFMRPAAGGEGEWLKQNWRAFMEKAANGEEEFVDLVKDVEERGLLDQANAEERERDLKVQREMEEMLGWGDSA